MSNIFLNTVYIDTETLKASTDNAEIKAMSDDELAKLINVSQVYIDNYISSFGYEREDEAQETLFPARISGTEESFTIPNDIKKATVLLSETIHNTQVNNMIEKAVKSGPRSITYEKADGKELLEKMDVIHGILNKYKVSNFSFYV